MLMLALIAAAGIFMGPMLTPADILETSPYAYADRAALSIFAFAADSYVKETGVPDGKVAWSAIRDYHESKHRGGLVAFRAPSDWYISGDGSKWVVCAPMGKQRVAELNGDGCVIQWDKSLSAYEALCN